MASVFSLQIVLTVTVLMSCTVQNLFAQKLTLSFEKVIGNHGNGVGQMIQPSGLAVDPSGNIYVADTGNSRILLFDRNGRYLRQMGGFGFGTGQFARPQGVAATGLDVFVADFQNRSVQRFDRSLNHVGTLSGDPAVRPDTPIFARPWGIGISGLGDIFITDNDTEEVVRMTTSGQVATRFGGFNEGRGRLREPTGIAVGRNGQVYVADTGNSRVAVFDGFGGFLRQIGTGTLSYPRGVTLGGAARVFVADTGNSRIVILTDQGELLLSYGAEGAGIGSFNGPSDIAVFDEKFVLVADTENHRIQVFLVSEIPDHLAK